MESNTTDSNSFSWKDVNWDALRRLRARFLQFDEPETKSDAKKGGDYWRSHSELASYNHTFGERIGWKWDAVLAELKVRGWTPPAGSVLDWGCGTGVAGRRAIAAWPEQCTSLLLSDRSKGALHFATQYARYTYPDLSVEEADPSPRPDLLVVSHVINELSAVALEKLISTAERAQAVIWVEPGTAVVSRALIAVRERLMQKFRIIAPCTHGTACGLLTAGNERHWCHHFAEPPHEIFQESGWGKFAQMLELDLGSVPFSFLVLDRRPVTAENAAPLESTAARLIGRPRHAHGFDKILSCQVDGVNELMLQKRDAPALFKEMKKDAGSLYSWERDGDKIRGGQRLF